MAIASCALVAGAAMPFLLYAEAAAFCAVPLLSPNDDPQEKCETACGTSMVADPKNTHTGKHWYTTNCVYSTSKYVFSRRVHVF